MNADRKHKALVNKMRREYTRSKYYPAFGWTIFLRIGHQSFATATKLERIWAAWSRDQLAEALARLVENEGGK